MHTANLQLLLREHGVIGSSPILAQRCAGQLSRQSTYIQRQMHLVYIAGWSSRLARLAHYQKVSGSNPLPATRYSTGGAMVAHLAHYQETRFESFGCNQGCPRPIYTERSVWAYLTKVRCLSQRERMDSPTKLPPAQPNIQASFFTALLEACDMWLVICIRFK